MKAFKIRKKKYKQPVFIKEVMPQEHLPKPKMPYKVFFKPVEHKGWAEVLWEDGKPTLRYHQY